jgi:hypothetical protein
MVIADLGSRIADLNPLPFRTCSLFYQKFFFFAQTLGAHTLPQNPNSEIQNPQSNHSSLTSVGILLARWAAGTEATNPMATTTTATASTSMSLILMG